MDLTATTLPDDIDTLQERLSSRETEIEHLKRKHAIDTVGKIVDGADS